MTLDNDELLPALEERLAVMRAERDALDEQIRRHEAAVAALNGRTPTKVRARSGEIARQAILAAWATHKAPVRTEDLLDHESLIHYSRNTLRSALADLHHLGKLSGTRGPKGYIWDPPDTAVH